MKEFDFRETNPPNAEVEVGIGEWRQASSEQTIGTYGLGPCKGIAIFDTATHTGYMAHAVAIELQTIRDMLAVVGEQTATTSTLRAWAGGNSPVPGLESESRQLIVEDRDAVIACLLEAGIEKKNIVQAWADNPDVDTSMILDCGSGTCYIVPGGLGY